MNESLFGTDGIRGTPGKYPLTDGMLFKIGSAAAKLLRQRKQGTQRPKIIIGKDTRLSCYELETILANGIISSGADVLKVGIVHTPGLAYLTHYFNADMGLMISASHNRPEDNGIKFFSSTGHKLSESEEEWLESIIFSSFIKFDELPSSETGSINTIEDAQVKYMEFLKSCAPDLDLTGLKIVVDCGFGAVANFGPQLLRQLGAEVFPISDRPDGANINVGCGVLHPEVMADMVAKFNADIGLAFDGDGDRLILSDEQGNILDGDYIMAIIGLKLMKENRLTQNTIVTTVMSNFGFEETIKRAGGRLIRTPVGDKYILDAMRKRGFTFGGEQSGHIIFLDYSTTGDALITALQILKVMKETNKKLSRLSQCMRKLPQVLTNVKVREKMPFDSITRVSEVINQSKDRLESIGRLLVRYSGTEPVARIMVEGKDERLIKEIADTIAKAIQDTLGIDNK